MNWMVSVIILMVQLIYYGNNGSIVLIWGHNLVLSLNRKLYSPIVSFTPFYIFILFRFFASEEHKNGKPPEGGCGYIMGVVINYCMLLINR